MLFAIQYRIYLAVGMVDVSATDRDQRAEHLVIYEIWFGLNKL